MGMRFLSEHEQTISCQAVSFACRTLSLKMADKTSVRAIKSKVLERLSLMSIKEDTAATAIQARIRGLQTRIRISSATSQTGGAILSELAQRRRNAAYKRKASGRQRLRARRMIARTARNAAVRRGALSDHTKGKQRFIVESR